MTRQRFLARLREVCGILQEPTPHGHSLRVGSTLEYLLRGVAFDVVREQGRWVGDSFKRYLRLHGQILAPYLQGVPELEAELARITMPRCVR
jgi:hypothetical protein